MKKVIVVVILTFILGVVASNTFGQAYQPENTPNWQSSQRLVNSGILKLGQTIQVDIANIIHHHEEESGDISFYTKLFGQTFHIIVFGRTDCKKYTDYLVLWHVSSNGNVVFKGNRKYRESIDILPNGKVTPEDYIIQETMYLACSAADAEHDTDYY